MLSIGLWPGDNLKSYVETSKVTLNSPQKVAHGEEQWFDSVSSDPVKLKTVVVSYLARIDPEITGVKRAKKGVFVVSQYKACSFVVSAVDLNLSFAGPCRATWDPSSLVKLSRVLTFGRDV